MQRVRLSAFICFESSFPAHVRRLVAREPQLLVNLSDDSWFGARAEPEQHLSQVVFRAIESRRDVVRVAASGISAHVAATGAIVRQTGVSLVQGNTTLSTEPSLLRVRGLYASLGDLFAGACALVSILLLVVALLRREGAPGHEGE